MIERGRVWGNSGLKGEEGVAPSSKAGWESFWQFHTSDDQHVYAVQVLHLLSDEFLAQE